MARSKNPTSKYYWILTTAGILLLSALLMAAVRLLYPPIPMFIAAIAAGIFFRSRPVEAARAGAVAGLAGGLPAEWIYFSLRAKLAAHVWAGVSFWEKTALGLAELLLYAALLSFFAAFVSWNAETPKARPKIKAVDAADENERLSGSNSMPLPSEPFSASMPSQPTAFKADSPDQRKKD